MPISYTEESRNERSVFVIDAEDAIEAFTLLSSEMFGMSMGYEGKIVLIHTLENTTEEQLQKIRDSLSGNM